MEKEDAVGPDDDVPQGPCKGKKKKKAKASAAENALRLIFDRYRSADPSTAVAFQHEDLKRLLQCMALTKKDGSTLRCDMHTAEVQARSFVFKVSGETMRFEKVLNLQRLEKVTMQSAFCNCLACGQPVFKDRTIRLALAMDDAGFCARCHMAYYCTKECQTQHWVQHKDFCAAVAVKRPPEPVSGPIVRILHEHWDLALLTALLQKPLCEPSRRNFLLVINEFLQHHPNAAVADIAVPYRETIKDGLLRADFGLQRTSKVHRACLVGDRYRCVRSPNLRASLLHQTCAPLGIAAPLLCECATDRQRVLQDTGLTKAWLNKTLLLVDDPELEAREIRWLAALRVEMRETAKQLRAKKQDLAHLGDHEVLTTIFERAARKVSDAQCAFCEKQHRVVATLLTNGVLLPS